MKIDEIKNEILKLSLQDKKVISKFLIKNIDTHIINKTQELLQKWEEKWKPYSDGCYIWLNYSGNIEDADESFDKKCYNEIREIANYQRTIIQKSNTLFQSSELKKECPVMDSYIRDATPHVINQIYDISTVDSFEDVTIILWYMLKNGYTEYSYTW